MDALTCYHVRPAGRRVLEEEALAVVHDVRRGSVPPRPGRRVPLSRKGIAIPRKPGELWSPVIHSYARKGV